MMTTEPKPCFYALILIGAGSSWFYSTTPEKAAASAARQAKSDWGTMYNFKPGSKIKVNVFDVTEIPDGSAIGYNDRGVFAELLNGDHRRIELHSKIEVEL